MKMAPVTTLARVSDLDRYMAEIRQYRVLNAEEERELAIRWRDHQDTAAAHALVTANLRFVVKIAMEYRGYTTRLLDLIQEGSVGLMQAVKRFDPDRGYRLISFAVYWIRAYIHSFLMGSMHMIKIGTSRAHRKLFFKLRSLKGKLGANGHLTEGEVLAQVATKTGVRMHEVIEMDRYMSSNDASLDAPVGEAQTSLAELLPNQDINQETMFLALEEKADLSARLEAALATLLPKEREIIEKRFLQESPLQLKDIGAAMGVSKQRVSQLEQRAMGKLKNALQAA
jgi:RNA polymerase sigma-32 factor